MRSAAALSLTPSHRLDRIAALCGDRVASACRRLVRGASPVAVPARPRRTSGAAATSAHADTMHVALPTGAGAALAGLVGAAPRASVLDAVRCPLEAALGTAIQLRQLRLNVANGWAFLIAEPLDADVRPLDLTGAADPAPRLCALARAEADGTWRTVAYAFDGQRATWERWPQRFGVAADVFPHRAWSAAA